MVQMTIVGVAVGVAQDDTPFFAIFTILRISAAEKFDLIFERNHRMAIFFLNTAQIRIWKKLKPGSPFKNRVTQKESFQ